MTVEQFGIFKPGTFVEKAVVDTLKKWMPDYLNEVGDQMGLSVGAIKLPRQYAILSEFENWPNETPPIVAVVAPGLHDDPKKDGQGAYRAPWSVFIAAIVSGQTRESSRYNAQLYGMAIRAIMLQKKALGGVSTGTGWVDEDYTDGPKRKARTLATVQGQFWVEMEDVVNDRKGPIGAEPPGHEGPWTAGDRDHIILEITDEEVT